MKSNFIKDALILFVITFILGIMLSSVEQLTEGRIQEENEKSIKAAYISVVGTDDFTTEIIENDTTSDKATLQEILSVTSGDGEDLGYITTTVVKGYGGNIKIITGFDNELKITGISYPETLSETPGLGMKVTDNDKFINHYIGVTGPDIVNGYTISGATISSSAVREGLKLAFTALVNVKGGK